MRGCVDRGDGERVCGVHKAIARRVYIYHKKRERGVTYLWDL